LLGVGATKLTREPIIQGDLFDDRRHERQEALDETIDTIRAQFGTGSIQRGSLLERPRINPKEEEAVERYRTVEESPEPNSERPLCARQTPSGGLGAEIAK
jgi:hypothetical protein